MNKEEIIQAREEELRTFLGMREEFLLNELIDYIKELQQENKQLKERVETLKEAQIKQLQIIKEKDEQIDKAIKYMDNEIIIRTIAYDKLYEILKGETNE